MRERINCSTADCSRCQNAVKVERIFDFGKPMYTCESHPKKHKNISANECINFRCRNSFNGILCQGCCRGK